MKLNLIFRECFFWLSTIFIVIQAANIDSNNLFDQLREATSNIPGWTENREQFQRFTAKELYNIIDGGAAAYQKQGLKNGISVSLMGNSRSLQIYFEDFGGYTHAKNMVNVKKKSSSDPRKVPLVKITTAIYDEVIGGCVVYWAKGRCYVEMTLTGYESLEKSLADAMNLINGLAQVIPDK